MIQLKSKQFQKNNFYSHLIQKTAVLSEDVPDTNQPTDKVAQISEIIELILQHCDKETLATCTLVSKLFCKVAFRIRSHCYFKEPIRKRAQFLKFYNALTSYPHPIYPNAFSFISELNFKNLQGRSSFIDDTFLQSLAGHQVLPLALTRFYLYDCTQITDAGLYPFLLQYKKLTILVIHGSDQLTDASFAAFAHGESQVKRNLKRLEFHGLNQITDTALALISSQSRALEHVDISFSKHINGPGLEALLRYHASTLQFLRFRSCGRITDA